ncbi:integrase [Streptomyces pactum]|uniref:integrase n=1 Tax=Streptomyces pactum TaxID=68249 RepID=UPI0018D5BC2B|nr:integrase [Streptomyces pactum]
MSTVGKSSGRWHVYRYDLKKGQRVPLPEACTQYAADLGAWVAALGGAQGQWFLIGPDGRPDLRVNAFFSSAKMRGRAVRTNRDYAYSVCLWLNFLLSLDRGWWEATEDDAREFQFWRVTDPRNPQRVQRSSFYRDAAGLKTFYRWVGGRFQVVNPFEELETSRGRKQEDVKWLDPDGYVRWRDLGLRGLDLDGREDAAWGGRNEQRDGVFADGLYGTGLRLSEWASVVLPELPEETRGRGYYTCALADACAKGGYGHAYWMPRAVLSDVLSYVEGSRARAVRRAQVAGRYERVPERRVAVGLEGRRMVTLETEDGGHETTAWNDLDPTARKLLFRRTWQGLEPLALWLNEDGLPRDGHGWHHTFEVANQRIAALGLEDFSCTPHMLRHSLALKWYAVAKLVQARQLGHLSQEETRDFREQFGDHWHLVQTMLGHRRVETTKNVYLEPFRNLEVELLLRHADGFPVERFMADVFAGHPRVRTDPLAVR